MSGLLAWRHQWQRQLTPSRPLGSATLYVDPTDGNATTMIDLFPITTRVGARISLVHNSDSTRTGHLSQGWILSLNERLFDNDPTDIVYMDKTGAEWTFTGSGPGYTRPAGLRATLRELTGGGWVLFMHTDFSVKTFNAAGWLTEIRDRNGNTLLIARSGSDEITKVTTDDSGEAVTLLDTFVYVSGRLTKIGKSDCGGWHWLLGFDGSDRFNLLTDPEANTLATTYDSTSSRLASVTDWRGNATAVAYTGGKVTTVTDPLTKTDTVAYPTGAQTTITDRRGKLTTFNHTGGKVDDITPPIANMKLAWTYTTDFQVLSETNQIPATKAWTYDLLGNLATSTNELGKVWTYTTDQVEATISATETSTTDPDGNETTVRYDGRGSAVSVLSPMGFLTKHTFNGNGDLILTTPPKGPSQGASYDPLTGMPTASFILADPKGMGGAAGPAGDSLPPAETSLCQQAASTIAYDTLLPWLPARIQDADGVAQTMLHNKVGMVTETAAYADGVKMATTLTQDANGNLLTVTDAEGGVTTNVFNANNLPTTVTDAEGNATVITYDFTGNLTRRTDPAGKFWDQTFDDASRLLTQTNPNAGVTTYTYNAASSVTNTNDKRGNNWAVEYDDAQQVTKRKTPTTWASTADTTYTYTNTGLLATTTDPLSNVTTNIYDNDSRLVEVRKPLGSVARTHFDSAGRVVGTIDPTGAATTYGYDYLGRQARVTDPRGNTITRTYTPGGRVLTVTTPTGATTTNGYDGAGRLVKTTNPEGASTIYEFNANGQRTAVSTTDDGARTETAHNKVGQPILVRVKSSRDGRAYWLETATTYNSRGLVDTVTNPAGRVNQNTYDNAGQVTKLTKDVGGIAATVDYTLDANGNQTKIENSIDASTKTEHSMTYNKANWKTQDKHKVSATPTYETTDYTLDNLGRATTITFPDTNTFVFVFDALGRRTKWTDRLGRATEYEFDLAGRQTLMTTPDLKETHTAYDATGNMVQRVFRGDPADTAKDVVETFTFTAGNRLHVRTDPDGRETTMAHNSLGLLTTVTDAMGNTRENVYSAGGRLVAQTAPGNAAIYYVYTLDGRIARVTGFSGFTKEYEWCCCGMESYTDEQGTTLLEHNALSQLTSIAYASGLTVTLTPNHLNWNTKTTLPKTSGTEDTSYSYDLRGRVLSITVPDTSATTITIAHDSMGRPTTIVYSGSHTVVYAWDAMGRSTTITSTGKDAANTYVLTYAYVTNADRVSSVTTTAAGATVSTQTYTYNARLQITKEKVQDGTPTTTWERDYSWTAAGLRTKIDDLFSEWDSTFAHDPAGRLSLIQTTDNSGGAKPNPFPWWEGDTRVSTSPNGDVVSMVSGANRITYRYDEEMRLVEAQMASGDPVAVTYDGMGSLVSIVQGATTQKTLTHQGRILQTRNAADAIQDKLFWAGNNLMRTNLNASARNQAWDARGSNVLSYQTDGTMDKTRLWDNWGLEVFAAGAGSAPDVGFRSDFDLGSSGLSLTPQNNAWWAELGRRVEGGWRPRFFCWPWLDPNSQDCKDSDVRDGKKCTKGGEVVACASCTEDSPCESCECNVGEDIATGSGCDGPRSDSPVCATAVCLVPHPINPDESMVVTCENWDGNSKPEPPTGDDAGGEESPPPDPELDPDDRPGRLCLDACTLFFFDDSDGRPCGPSSTFCNCPWNSDNQKCLDQCKASCHPHSPRPYAEARNKLRKCLYNEDGECRNY